MRVGRASLVGVGSDLSNIKPKLIDLFWIGISSIGLGVGSNKDGNLILGRSMSKDGMAGIK